MITVLARSSGMPKDTGARVKTPAMSAALVIGRSIRRRRLKKALCGRRLTAFVRRRLWCRVIPAYPQPGDLARKDIAVGYHSGSHFSALQALEVFLPPEDIALKFVGTSWSRVDAALARKIPAVNVWGPQLYLLEQHGFRRIVSTTFMMAFMFPP